MNLINASALKTDRRAGIVIPTALRHDFTPFLRALEKALLDNKVKPLADFLVSMIETIEKAPFHLEEQPVKASEWNTQIRTGF